MIVSLLALVGCQNEELVKDNSTDNGNGKKVTLTATIAGTADSRVVLSEETEYDEELKQDVPVIKVEWKESGETFKVHGSQSEWSEFKQTQGNNFQGTLPEGADYAYYGYGENLSYNLSAQNGTLNESYVLMQAPVTDSSSKITFEHKTAILKVAFKMKEGGGIISNNTISQIVMDNVHTGSDINSITVSRTGVSEEEKGNIYIFLPIGTDNYSGHTFNFTVTAGSNEYTGLLTIPTGMSIVGGNFYTATIKLTEIPYLTFTTSQAQTLELKQIGNYTLDQSIEYSVNGGAWTKFDMTSNTSTSVSFGGENGNLRMRGTSESGMAVDYENYVQIQFGNDTPVACSGDIRTLVNYENYSAAETGKARFCSLFSGCSSLTTAPSLPAETLAMYCYDSMFNGCTSLVVAPSLPATNLAEACYYSMFFGCTKLVDAPELPATNLASYCYQSMFQDCKILTNVTMLATDISATMCLDNWLSGVAANGIIKKAESMKSLKNNSVHGIPEGWTVQDYEAQGN